MSSTSRLAFSRSKLGLFPIIVIFVGLLIALFISSNTIPVQLPVTPNTPEVVPNNLPILSTELRIMPEEDVSVSVGTSRSSQKHARTPTYFLSIGGPTFMESTTHPAYSKLAAVGSEITSYIRKHNVKAIVVFSAHWQADSYPMKGYKSKIQVNTAEHTDLIYDFYGFPKHYYEYKWPNRGSPEVAEKVIQKLNDSGLGIEVEKVTRELDHGVWAGFMVAFDSEKNPLNIPIVQVSLLDNDDPDQHYRLGQTLSTLRDEGILIIGAGMAVHNLRDFRAIRGTDTTMPYAYSFDEALNSAATVQPPSKRQASMSALFKRPDTRMAHPSVEHLLPVYIAAGAGDVDVGGRIWTLPEGSMSWAQYRFGNVEA